MTGENIYKINTPTDFEFFWAKTEQEATEKFKKVFQDEEVVSVEFQMKADGAMYRATMDGDILRI